jgi:hypothetical protein
MKDSRDKVIMTHLMTVFLNLGHHANLRAFLNIAVPLLTDTEHAEWLTSVGDWEAVLPIYHCINAPLPKVVA